MNPQDGLGPQIATTVRDWLTGLLSNLLPEAAAGLVTDVVLWLVVAVLVYAVVQISMLYATWIERKVVGRIQDRIGPNRVGWFGLTQPFADMIKMLVKEDVTPAGAHRWVYNLGPMFVVPPAILVFAVIPAGIWLAPPGADLSIGFLFFTAVGSTAVIPIFMAGWGSRNKYALIGAVRAVAQIVSYEIPQVLSVVGVLLLAGTLSMQGIVTSQGPLAFADHPAFPGVWFILLQPIGFLIFLMATAAEVERTPFDIPEAESEIIAGYHVEYAGIKFGMFYLAIYFMTIAASALAAVLFLGGWQPPVDQLAFIPGWVWLTVKTLAMVLVFMWLRGTLPRLRVDQMMEFCWKVLVPLSLANLLVAGLVGKLTHQIDASAPVILLGFTLANVLLLALTVWLIALWRGQGRDQQAPLGPTTATEGTA